MKNNLNYQSKIKKIKIKEEPLRFVALGGLEEIGRNMMFLEYKNEIIIIDAGLQFPEEETPGIDFIIPNTTYLEERKKNIKALIITHGHYDHIGAIPYIIDKIGNPPIYATLLTKEIILKRQEDFLSSQNLNFQVIKGGESYNLGQYFKVKFFDVVHNIPEGVGMIIETPIGNVVHPGEFKFDYDHNNNIKGLETWAWVGKQKIHTLMLDSTGAEVPGWGLSERIVEQEIEKLFKQAEGRIILGTFASLLDRINEIIKIAEKLNKKIAISGRSMIDNIEIAKRLGFIKPKNPHTFINLQDISKYKDNQLLLLCTGAQGEPNASLMKIANGEHKYIKIKPGDTIILSSSIVPGNERSVQKLKDNLARQGAIIYHYKMLDIHSSGHAPQEELKTVMKLVKPKFFLPIHGYYFMRWRNAKLAQETLNMTPEQTILTDNGKVVNLFKDRVEISKERVPANYVMVDGLGVGDVSEIVLRDRRILAQEGMITITIILSRQNGKILKNPEVTSRGFIYNNENQDLLNEIKRRIKGIIGRIPTHQPIDNDYLKTIIRDQIGQFIYKKTKRRPMILLSINKL